MKSAVTLALLCMLTACGWHLRGSEPLPVELSKIYLKIENEQSEFARNLKRALRASGVELVAEQSESPYTLQIGQFENDRRTISTSDRGKPAEYELSQALTFQVSHAGEIIKGPSRLMTERVYLFDPENIAGAVEEEALIRGEMQRELAAQLLRQYRAIDPTTY